MRTIYDATHRSTMGKATATLEASDYGMHFETYRLSINAPHDLEYPQLASILAGLADALRREHREREDSKL